jgi:hypothetical protein
MVHPGFRQNNLSNKKNYKRCFFELTKENITNHFDDLNNIFFRKMEVELKIGKTYYELFFVYL